MNSMQLVQNPAVDFIAEALPAIDAGAQRDAPLRQAS
jgi:hypothetical protein